ncbi:MAG: DUF6125 family protein [Promethearchaeota archaeon]
MNENEHLLDSLSDKQKIEMFRKNWTSHDGRWQKAVVQEFGWVKGNKLNKEVTYEFGKVIMYRMMNALGISKVKNMDEFLKIYNSVIKFHFLPPNTVYDLKKQSDSSLIAYVRNCFSYVGVKKVGATKLYECPCFKMRAGFYDALGIDVEEKPIKRLMNGDDCCEIVFNINNWSKE